jgi:hypothetical protein
MVAGASDHPGLTQQLPAMQARLPLRNLLSVVQSVFNGDGQP